MADDAPKVINLDDHRWIEAGSDEWQREVMETINELIDRVRYLEARSGVSYDRMQRTYRRTDER